LIFLNEYRYVAFSAFCAFNSDRIASSTFVAYTGFLRVSSSPNRGVADVVFPSPGAGSIAATLIHLR
jgi:hypothetical protein